MLEHLLGHVDERKRQKLSCLWEGCHAREHSMSKLLTHIIRDHICLRSRSLEAQAQTNVNTLWLYST